MASYHSDVLDNGLITFNTANQWHGGAGALKRVLCAGLPASRTAANTVYPGGNRATAVVVLTVGDMTLGNRDPNGRHVVTAEKATTVAVTVSDQLLYHVLYDDDRLLAISDALPARSLTLNEAITLPAWSLGLAQPS